MSTSTSYDVTYWGLETHVWSWIVSGICTIVATVLSLYLIREHVLYNKNEPCRKQIVRILLMPPIYAIESWLSLRFYTYRNYFDALRSLYEALVIFSFYNFLILYVRGSTNFVAKLKEIDYKAKHFFPFCLLPEYKPAERFVTCCKWGALQYVYIRSIFSILTLILLPFNLYTDGDFTDFKNLYIYDTLATNFSQIFALYSLVIFYKGSQPIIAPIRPVPKFIAIKAVVFATFWQGVIIGIIQQTTTWIHDYVTYSADDVAAGIQDFAICIEMLIASIFHTYVFKPSDFDGDDIKRHDDGKKRGVLREIGSAVNVLDIMKIGMKRNSFSIKKDDEVPVSPVPENVALEPKESPASQGNPGSNPVDP